MAPILEVRNLSHIYSIGTPFQHIALDDVSFSVEQGEFVGIIGHTGSGKSTLIQHLNGLLKPTSGTVMLDSKDIWENKATTRQTRFRVGLVFQYPEYQLFEETVYKDIAFGPKNMGLEPEEIDRRVRQAAGFVGLTEEQLNASPFDLSGGQKRRVAIAGVIAMEPQVLILDEPTAGLDPEERIRIRNLISKISLNRIVLYSTHVVSDIEFIADKILCLKQGVLIAEKETVELYKDLDGKVFLVELTEEELKTLPADCIVSSMTKTKDKKLQVRVITDSPLQGITSIPVSANLEDVYLALFQGEKE